ncbi:hypothetical protein [Paenibacillus sp. YYML68]|uniref:hypothetical protein n=1 Tax=Paenibacillus sp. YYML68 TaxID=2909250 RepID=UPI00249300B1|nr:hypothetical protein [Paenibacillus sp. YYML68]
MKRLILLTLIFVVMLTAPSPAWTAYASSEGIDTQSKGYRLLIYYGTPKAVNGVWDEEKSAKALATYDVVVLGQNLETTSHTFHKSTFNVIKLMKENNPNIAIYGYVDLGVSTLNLSIANMKSRVDSWKSMGATGIFLDDAGYDYKVPRERLNTMVNYVHDQGMSAFINAWHPKEVFGSEPHPVYNPTGAASAIDERDIYLLEDFLQETDITASSSISVFTPTFRKKLDELLHYRKETGVRLMSVSIMDFEQYSDTAIRKFFRMNEVTAGVFSLDGYGLSPIDYSADKPYSNLLRKFPYISNYNDFHTIDVTYTAKYKDLDFARGGFRLHSLPNEHYYLYPKEAKF